MNNERTLSPEDAASAAHIQTAIDDLAAAGGGRLTLPELDLTLDRGLQLRHGIELVGQGDATILRKGPGRVYPLTGYHNYGMRDVPVHSTAGLAPGMTVSINDDKRGGFYGTFARITFVDDGWVGLDQGINADYLAEDNPRLSTVYPLIFGHGISGAAVRNLHLEGNKADNEEAMNACRGAALYFYKSHDIEVTDVTERDYRGEGLGYQMCSDVRVSNCTFNDNTGNGFHPGAGSTKTSFHGCIAERNESCGFFFCVRANHITVSDCRFAENTLGMSIGTRDCHNLIRGCSFLRNKEAGIVFRPCPKPVEVHSIVIDSCDFQDNGGAAHAQLQIDAEAHTIIIENCRLSGQLGIRGYNGLRNLYLQANNSTAGVELPDAALTATRPGIVAGYGSAEPVHLRHLRVQ